MSRTNGIPFFQEFYCPLCKTWQLKQVKGTRCIFCGANIPINVEWRDPPTTEGMLQSEKAFAEAKDPYKDAINTVFCSHCGGVIVAGSEFCRGCGNPKDPTDIKPKAFIGNNEVPLEYLPTVQPGLEKPELSYPVDLTETFPSPAEQISQEDSD